MNWGVTVAAVPGETRPTYAFAPLQRLHLSEDVAGATFMAAGSSAPELFTSVIGRCYPEEHLSSVLPEERGLWKQEC